MLLLSIEFTEDTLLTSFVDPIMLLLIDLASSVLMLSDLEKDRLTSSYLLSDLNYNVLSGISLTNSLLGINSYLSESSFKSNL
jgi:hypothetical protein